MRSALWLMLFVSLLSACGSAATANPPAASAPTPTRPARPAPPSNPPAATEIPTAAATEIPTAAATEIPTAAAPASEAAPVAISAPAPAGDANPPTTQPDDNDPGAQPPPLDLADFSPAGGQHVVWQGVDIAYDPQFWVFSLNAPFPPRDDQPTVLAAASLRDPIDRCAQPWRGSECFNAWIGFSVYDRKGLGLREWVGQAGSSVFWWPPEFGFPKDAEIGGRPALYWAGDGVAAGFGHYAVELGDRVLLIQGVSDEAFLEDIHFVEPGAPLVPGIFAMVKPGQTADLWDSPAGGARVVERPQLHAGSFADIQELTNGAARVRTIDNVIGWVRDADKLLTTATEIIEPQAAFVHAGATYGVPARVIHANPIPLRALPNSKAPAHGPTVNPGTEVSVTGVTGDWVFVNIGEGGELRSGWMRWHYDGAAYIEPIR